MASAAPITSPFIAKLLAPLVGDVEQVNDKQFMRAIEDDADKALSLAIALAERAKAIANVHGAEMGIVLATKGWEPRNAMCDEQFSLWNRYRAATLAVARTPALTKTQLRRKLGAIGKVWLHTSAEGEFYDALRAGVAADEARLAAVKATTR